MNNHIQAILILTALVCTSCGSSNNDHQSGGSQSVENLMIDNRKSLDAVVFLANDPVSQRNLFEASLAARKIPLDGLKLLEVRLVRNQGGDLIIFHDETITEYKNIEMKSRIFLPSQKVAVAVYVDTITGSPLYEYKPDGSSVKITLIPGPVVVVLQNSDVVPQNSDVVPQNSDTPKP